MDLYENKIGNKGTIALANILLHNNHLTYINLSHNNIKDKGAVALADALIYNKCLNELNLEYNRVGNTGAIALANVLKYNTYLKHLYLYNNYISYEGVVAISKTLINNIYLNTLTINTFCENAIVAIVEILKYNKSLRSCILTCYYRSEPARSMNIKLEINKTNIKTRETSILNQVNNIAMENQSNIQQYYIW